MVLVAAMLRRVTNLQILVRRSRIFSPRRREKRERKAISKTSRSSRLRGEFGLSFTAKALSAPRNREDFLG